MMRYDRLLNATNSLSHLDEFVEACVRMLDSGMSISESTTLPTQAALPQSDVVKLIQKHGLSDRQFSFFESEEEFMSVAASTPRSNCVMDSSKAIKSWIAI